MATGEGSKGADVKEGHQGQLGACPYSCRVLLTLEEKEIPYELEYINVDDKPKWLLDVNPNGTVPVVRGLATGLYFVDSSVICDWLEEKFNPDSDISKKSLKKLDECPQPGRDIIEKFWDYLKDDNNRQALVDELKQIDGAISNENPFLGGQTVCASDLALAPKLYLARFGCKHFKKWDFCDELDNVKVYLHRMTGRPSWRNAASWDEESIVEDLQHKMEKMEKMKK